MYTQTVLIESILYLNWYRYMCILLRCGWSKCRWVQLQKGLSLGDDRSKYFVLPDDDKMSRAFQYPCIGSQRLGTDWLCRAFSGRQFLEQCVKPFEWAVCKLGLSFVKPWLIREEFFLSLYPSSVFFWRTSVILKWCNVFIKTFWWVDSSNQVNHPPPPQKKKH